MTDRRTLLKVVFATVVLHLVLVQPNHPAAMAWDALLLFPLELPWILLTLLAVGQSRVGWFLRVFVVVALVCIAVLKSADYVMFTSLNRGFNLVADLPLVASLNDLIVGTFGRSYAVFAIIGSMLLTFSIAALLWWACGICSSLHCSKLISRLAAVAAVIAAVVVTIDVGSKMNRWSSPINFPGTAFTARVGLERIDTARQTIADLRLFRAAAKQDPFANRTGMYDLVDRDVIIVFVESYGRTSLDTEFYASKHRQTLVDAQAQLKALGLAMSSTFLSSPTKGGQSWLAHSTFANGLWIDNQISYAAALNSGRQSLFHIAARSGFRTAAVMPQITLEWPESQFMGFDTILAQRDLGYAGKPFNWITMPDQFTFTAMDRLLRTESEGKPHMFIQMALGSSHAPWVPVPDFIAWEEIGDGTIFDSYVEASDPPSVVWKDEGRIRKQYRDAIDYALNTVFSYAALHAENPPLMIIIGDHQAAGFVALDDRPDVLMHIVGPGHLVDLVSDNDFHQGLIPPHNTLVRSMDLMRAHLLNSLSTSSIAEKAE